MEHSAEELTALINKRITINLLIQGVADHAMLTAHHLVAPELRTLNQSLVNEYDRFTSAAILSAWYGMNALTNGSATRFWKGVRKPSNPFCHHPLLVRHGPALAEATRCYVVARARKCGIIPFPFILTFQISSMLNSLPYTESRILRPLEDLATRLTSEIWGIDRRLLDARITREVAFGELRPSKTAQAVIMRSTAVGYGGVLRAPNGELRVVARGLTFTFLVHELVKGTAELVCLHGFNRLDAPTWKAITDVTDRIELEPWCMQAGAELWRRVLAVLPGNADLAHTLMRISLLSPDDLETLMVAVLEDPAWARQLMGDLPERVGE